MSKPAKKAASNVGGATRYTMTESAMQRLYHACGYTKQLEKLKGMYIVVANESATVITVAHLPH